MRVRVHVSVVWVLKFGTESRSQDLSVSLLCFMKTAKQRRMARSIYARDRAYHYSLACGASGLGSGLRLFSSTHESDLPPRSSARRSCLFRLRKSSRSRALSLSWLSCSSIRDCSSERASCRAIVCARYLRIGQSRHRHAKRFCPYRSDGCR